jgi:hypothetical protein
MIRRAFLMLALAAPALALAQENGPRPEDLVRRIGELGVSATNYSRALTPARIRSTVLALRALRESLSPGEIDRPDAPVPEGWYRIRFRAVLSQTMRKERPGSVTQWEDFIPTAWTSQLVLDSQDAYARCLESLPDVSNYSHAELIVPPRNQAVQVLPERSRPGRAGICAGLAAHTIAHWVPVSRGARSVALLGPGSAVLFGGEDSQSIQESCMKQGHLVAQTTGSGSAVLVLASGNNRVADVAGLSDHSALCQGLLRHILSGGHLSEPRVVPPLGDRDVAEGIEKLALVAAQARDLKSEDVARAISAVGDIELSLGGSERKNP